jgi:hypothetical protein
MNQKESLKDKLATYINRTQESLIASLTRDGTGSPSVETQMLKVQLDMLKDIDSTCKERGRY